MPPPPPQWQGSEDALAPPVDEGEGDEELLELGMLGGDDGEGGEGEGEMEDGGEKQKKARREVIDDSEDELAL